ncbi:MAG TPA: universal stress protein [Candidatus Acidoferrales bacterium]|nr:universal stress protein [Candidatus Acidoferrales bacterium]
MYTRILVPLDGSKLAEQILPYARAFAVAFAARVDLLKVDDPEAMVPYLTPLAGNEYLEKVSRGYFPASVEVDRVVEAGKPAEVIVDRARAERSTLIAMATHGLSGLRRWLLGSVASKVVQTAVSPVLLVRPVEGGEAPVEIRLNTILVPLDGSGLAEKILPHVSAVARKMNLEVCLVRAYVAPPSSYVVAEGSQAYSFDRVQQQFRREAEEYLKGKTEELQAEGLRVSVMVVGGDAAEQIIDLARTTQQNLIALSTHGRSGLKRWVLGSVAEKIVHHSRDPVLIVRPT